MNTDTIYSDAADSNRNDYGGDGCVRFDEGQTSESRTALEWAAERNTELLASYGKAIKASYMPGLFLFELAGQAFQGYATLQQSLLGAEARTGAGEAAQNSHEDAKTKAAIGRFVQQLMNRTVAANRPALKLAQQSATTAASDSGEQQPSVQYLDSVQLRILANEIVDRAILPLEITAGPSVN